MPNNVNLIFFNETQIYSVTLEKNFFPFPRQRLNIVQRIVHDKGQPRGKLKSSLMPKLVLVSVVFMLLCLWVNAWENCPSNKGHNFETCTINVRILQSLAISNVSFWPHIRSMKNTRSQCELTTRFIMRNKSSHSP